MSNIVSKTSVKIVSERRSKSKTVKLKHLQNFKMGDFWVGTMSLVPKLLLKIGSYLGRHNLGRERFGHLHSFVK